MELCAKRDNHVKTTGEDSYLQAKERCLGQILSSQLSI